MRSMFRSTEKKRSGRSHPTSRRPAASPTAAGTSRGHSDRTSHSVHASTMSNVSIHSQSSGNNNSSSNNNTSNNSDRHRQQGGTDASSSRTRRRDQQLSRSLFQQQQQEEQEQLDAFAQPPPLSSTNSMASKRRDIGFIKYGVTSNHKRSSSSVTKTREHAKQIAMAVSLSASEQEPAFADFGSAFAKDPFAAFPRQEEPTESTTHTDECAFGHGDFFAADVFSDPGIDTDWPVGAPAMAPPKAASAVGVGTARRSRRAANPVSAAPSHATTNRSAKQSRSATQEPRSPEPTHRMASPTPPTSAAARRRMRTQMRGRREAASSDDSRTSSPPRGSRPAVGPKATNHVAHYQSSRTNTTSREASKAGGFSFDAFGLDGAAIDAQVSQAVNDLAGSHGHLGFASLFHDTDWTHDPTDDPPGFVDGFRVTKPNARGIVKTGYSPTRSDPSTVTSDSTLEDPGRVNVFKQQAGFHASSKPRTVVRPAHGAVPTNAPAYVSPSRRERESGEFFGEDSSASSADVERSSQPPHALSSRPQQTQQSQTQQQTQPPQQQQQRQSPQRRPQPTFPGVASMEPYRAVDPEPQYRGRYPEQAGGREPNPASSETGVTVSDAGAPSDMGVNSDIADASDFGANTSDIGLLPFIEVKDKKARAESVRTESTVATSTTVEEKREEEMPVLKKVGNLRSQWESRESALAREAAERTRIRQNVPSSLSKEDIARLQDQLGNEILSPEKMMLPTKDWNRQHEPRPFHRGAPDVPQVRAAECVDQRASVASAKQRLQHTPYQQERGAVVTKSEGGAAVRKSSVSDILTNLEKKASTTPQTPRSDTGVSPALYGVKLRRTGFSRESPSPNENKTPIPSDSSNASFATTTYSSPRSAAKGRFESQAMKLVRQQEESYGSPRSNRSSLSPTKQRQAPPQPRGSPVWANRNTEARTQRMLTSNTNLPSSPSAVTVQQSSQYDDPSNQEERTQDSLANTEEPSPRPQLTYRERRELELQQKREEEERQSELNKSSEPERLDVASLIKRRVAAAKHNTSMETQSMTSEQNESVVDFRSRLRPVVVKEPARAASRTEQSPRGEAEYEDHASAYEQQTDESARSEIDFERQDRQSPRRQYGASPNQSRNVALESGPVTSMESKNTIPSPSRQYHGSPSRFDPVAPVESRNMPSPSRQYRESSPREAMSRSNQSRDLVIETGVVQQPADAPKRVQAGPDGSHALLMQQLQKRQPVENSEVTRETNARPLSAKRSTITATEVSDSGTEEHHVKTPKATMMMLNAFLAGRETIASDGAPAVSNSSSANDANAQTESDPTTNSMPALKDDPTYARYFKMLAVGMPLDVVKHAMGRDGLDASVMDGDHNKPVGIALKDDPEFAKYFRMLKMGLPLQAVKHSMERDGLDSTIMDQDHDLPITSKKKSETDEPKEKDSHRRARLHWKTLRKVTSNSLWAKIDQNDDCNIEIDEAEFQELFQAEKNDTSMIGTSTRAAQKRSSTVCVIDAKRANNGGIILARLKMSHDDMADAVDRIDEHALSAEQIEHIVEYLPTKEERKALENYMLSGGQDAAEKFDGLCECEKFMVSMMTVKHAKRKVSALLFKLQFEGCVREIQKEASTIERASEELSSSSRLRQLLGIVLTFGNRLNTAGNGKRKAGAFSLDSLLKLNQAKAFDKKTTFLQYIVLIVRRNNELLLDFKDDLPTVFTADKIFWDQCVADLEEVESQLENVRKIALHQARQAQAYRLRRRSKRDDPEESLSDTEDVLTLEEEVEALRATPIGLFTLSAIKYVSSLRDNIETTKEKLGRLLEYFGEDEQQMQPHELFSIIVSFSREFDKAKDHVFADEKKKLREERKLQGVSSKTNTPVKGTPGKQNTSARKAEHTPAMRSSNMQPSMSAVLNQMKSSGALLNRKSRSSDTEQSNQQDERNNVVEKQLNAEPPPPPPPPPPQTSNLSPRRRPIGSPRLMQAISHGLKSPSRQTPQVSSSNRQSPSYSSPPPQRAPTPPASSSSRQSPSYSSPPPQRAPDASQEQRIVSPSRTETQEAHAAPPRTISKSRLKERMRRHRAATSKSPASSVELSPSRRQASPSPRPSSQYDMTPKSPVRKPTVDSSDPPPMSPKSPSSNARLKKRLEQRNRMRRPLVLGTNR